MPEPQEEQESSTRGGKGPLVAAVVMAALACVLWFTGRQQRAKVQYQKSRAVYELPQVTLVDQMENQVRLEDLLRADRPTVLNFIYADCTTLSPVQSAGFASLQKQLGVEADRVRLVSVTIDPDNDTPPRMKEYLGSYGARPGWDFLTGSRSDLDAIMQAFNATMPTLASHYAVTFLRPAGAREWVRLQGLLNPSDLLREYRALEAQAKEK